MTEKDVRRASTFRLILGLICIIGGIVWCFYNPLGGLVIAIGAFEIYRGAESYSMSPERYRETQEFYNKFGF